MERTREETGREEVWKKERKKERSKCVHKDPRRKVAGVDPSNHGMGGGGWRAAHRDVNSRVRGSQGDQGSSHGVVIAAGHGCEQSLDCPPRRGRNATHDAEVDETNAPIPQCQQVSCSGPILIAMRLPLQDTSLKASRLPVEDPWPVPLRRGQAGVQQTRWRNSKESQGVNV